ncbi:hypothetical protein QR680_010485 [Steinernema hermaphroditum]|uniref:Uncharacterized protein n=1 Tax=Steinernema hermaphroditum TaxID=289476 RepID=A0AA39IP72_9BILA|nr:hypothetical protein QR680_010485 [Steinernema hermaphroditum]
MIPAVDAPLRHFRWHGASEKKIADQVARRAEKELLLLSLWRQKETTRSAIQDAGLDQHSQVLFTASPREVWSLAVQVAVSYHGGEELDLNEHTLIEEKPALEEEDFVEDGTSVEGGHDKLRESAGTKEVNDPKQPEPGPQDHKDDRKDQESSEEKVLKRKEVEESDVPAAASHSEKEESTEQSDVDVKRTSTSSQEAVPEDELVAKDGDLTAHVGAIETIPDDVVDIKAKELKTEQNRTPLSTKEQHAPAPQEETQIEDYVYDAKAPLECLSSTDIADYDNPAKEDVPDPGAFSFFSRELNLEPEKPDVAPSGSETLRDSKKRQSTDFAPSVRQLFSAFRVAPEQKVEEASKEFNLISWNKSEHAGITKNIKEEEKVVSTVEISEGDRKKDEEDLVEEKFVDPYRPTLFKLDEAELERYDSEIGRTELAATKVNKAAIAKIAKDVEEDVCVKEEEHQKVSQNEKGDESC